MGQVPANASLHPYLIIGNGRLARHLRYYFQQLSIPHLHWWRGGGKKVSRFLSRAEKVLVLISDDSIEEFIDRHSDGGSDRECWIHCSGMLSTPLAESAHPLMTFADTLYDLSTYQSIPFVTERGRKSFPELFPELKNPHVSIAPEQKPYYHAWCTMAGNFTTLLWSKFFAALEELGLDRQDAWPYLDRIVMNLRTAVGPLTGPLARGDVRTIEKHLSVLQGTPMASVYESFLELHKSGV